MQDVKNKSRSIASLIAKVFIAACLIQYSGLLAQTASTESNTNQWKPIPYSPYFNAAAIHHIALDSAGFLWIAHNQGITRFDGYNYIHFSSQNTPHFFKNDTVLYLTNRGTYLLLRGTKNEEKILDPNSFEVVIKQDELEKIQNINPSVSPFILSQSTDSTPNYKSHKRVLGRPKEAIDTQTAMHPKKELIWEHPNGVCFKKTNLGVWYQPQNHKVFKHFPISSDRFNTEKPLKSVQVTDSIVAIIYEKGFLYYNIYSPTSSKTWQSENTLIDACAFRSKLFTLNNQGAITEWGFNADKKPQKKVSFSALRESASLIFSGEKGVYVVGDSGQFTLYGSKKAYTIPALTNPLAESKLLSVLERDSDHFAILSTEGVHIIPYQNLTAVRTYRLSALSYNAQTERKPSIHVGKGQSLYILMKKQVWLIKRNAKTPTLFLSGELDNGLRSFTDISLGTDSILWVLENNQISSIHGYRTSDHALHFEHIRPNINTDPLFINVLPGNQILLTEPSMFRIIEGQAVQNFIPKLTSISYEKKGITYHINATKKEVLLPQEAYRTWVQLHFSDRAFFETNPNNLNYQISNENVIKINNKSIISLFVSGNYKTKLEVSFNTPLGQTQKEAISLVLKNSILKHPNAFIYFYILIIVSILLFAPLLYSIVILKKERKTYNEMLFKLKIQIGGYIFNSLNYGLQLQKTPGYSKQVDKELLTEIFRASKSLELFIETILRKHFSINEVSKSIEDFLRDQFKSSPISSSFTFIGDRKKKLPSPLVRDLKLIIFELSNNSLKYSGAKHFSINMNLEGNNLQVSVRDNGQLKNIGSMFLRGNGISNIHKRAGRNGGTAHFRINNYTGHGLLCDIILKC